MSTTCLDFPGVWVNTSLIYLLIWLLTYISLNLHLVSFGERFPLMDRPSFLRRRKGMDEATGWKHQDLGEHGTRDSGRGDWCLGEPQTWKVARASSKVSSDILCPVASLGGTAISHCQWHMGHGQLMEERDLEMEFDLWGLYLRYSYLGVWRVRPVTNIL